MKLLIFASFSAFSASVTFFSTRSWNSKWYIYSQEERNRWPFLSPERASTISINSSFSRVIFWTVAVFLSSNSLIFFRASASSISAVFRADRCWDWFFSVSKTELLSIKKVLACIFQSYFRKNPGQFLLFFSQILARRFFFPIFCRQFLDFCPGKDQFLFDGIV